jgi:hypothetical protein
MKAHWIVLALVAGCGGGSSSIPDASMGCGVVPDKMLHEDYCGVNSSMLCLYDHPEGMGF